MTLGTLGSAVSEPLLRAQVLRWAGWCGKTAKPLCFLRASVGDVRHFGFGRFGTGPQGSGSAMSWLVWQNLFVFLGLQ